MANVAEQLSHIDASTFRNDEEGRVAALNAAKALVSRLERPFERMFDFVWSQPMLMVSLKTANDMGLFQYLKSDESTDLITLAAATRSDPIFLRRILRVLVCGDLVESPSPDAYTANAFSTALREQEGLRQGIEVIYASTIPDLTNLPAYLKFHNYRNLTGQEGQQPWEWIFSVTPSQYTNIWDFMRAEMPARYAAFNAFLSAIRAGQPPWTSVYPPLDELVSGWRADTVFCVDVAGGQGRDLGHLADALHARGMGGDNDDDAAAAPRLVLQETATLLGSLPRATLHPRIEPVVHDFFTPQSVRGARVYFLRSVLHDWPDLKAREILQRLREAMTPGYSRILLVENVMPENAREAGLLAAAMDVNVLAHFSSLERTERQWKDLIEGAGLRFKGFVPFPRKPSGVIEEYFKKP